MMNILMQPPLRPGQAKRIMVTLESVPNYTSDLVIQEPNDAGPWFGELEGDKGILGPGVDTGDRGRGCDSVARQPLVFIRLPRR